MVDYNIKKYEDNKEKDESKNVVILDSNIEEITEDMFTDKDNIEEIILPSKIKRIGYRAFANLKRLKRIIIPDGTIRIENEAFLGCDNLESVILPSSLKELGKSLFVNCKKLKDVRLPQNISYLPDKMFKGCKSLDIILNDNIKELGNNVFEGCHKLSQYPSSVTQMGTNCFKNCHSLNHVKINEGIQYLPDGTFSGCLKLTDISYDGKELKIGKRVFKNCLSLTKIPPFIANYNESSFENCHSLQEISILGHQIPYACFRGCKNIKEIHNQENIYTLEPYAFSGCSSLKEISLKYITVIPAEGFSHCTNLETVNLPHSLETIGVKAFYNCKHLKNIVIPDTVRKIKNEAFKYCHSITSIRIPTSLSSFGDEAFSYMDSLQNIEVSPANETFMTPDGKILIHKKYQKLMLYASGIKDKTYSLKEYNLEYDIFNRSFVKPITGIGKFAFAGAKNLEELDLCCCTVDVEHTAFKGCINLKTLVIQAIPFYTTAGINTRIDGRYYYMGASKTTPYYPFETIEFRNLDDEDSLVWINQNGFAYFNNVKRIILPTNGSYFIGDLAFNDCKNLEDIDIPSCITAIGSNAFPAHTKLNFENGLQIRKLNQLTTDDKYIGKYKLYELDNGTYYIEQGTSIISITKDYIDAAVSHSDEIRDKPVLFIDFMNDLIRHELGIKFFFNGILFANMSLDNRQILFESLNKNDTFYLSVLETSELLDKKDANTIYLLKDKNFKKVVQYINYLKLYDLKDKYLFQKHFMVDSDNPLLIKMLEIYDANIKRLLKASLIDNNQDTVTQNLNDLLVLMSITGVFSDNSITRQRASTFISEKMFDEVLPNGLDNEYRIVGDDIHRIFNFSKLRDEFDIEFAEFFLENYKELINEERKKSGFIERVYTNFREISKTCTSNKGSQRKLKVTFAKCKNYLSKVKFDGVTNNLRDFAELIGAWYDHQSTWENAQRVYKESLSAPRNIFTPITYDDENNVIYDNNSSNDLREVITSKFSYEWLPKQSYDNLILGKYCNCCAHIEGAGQGIMRASMVLDNCQNLVIRNTFGEIIAKSTIFINREEGYGVFNNVESSLNYRTNEDLEKIYLAFLRGTQAFFDTYNKNNPSNPLIHISIGANRNTIISYLTDDKHPVVPIYQSLEYGKYSIDKYHYDGDWKIKQRQVLKR